MIVEVIVTIKTHQTSSTHTKLQLTSQSTHIIQDIAIMSKQITLYVYLSDRLIESYPTLNWALAETKRKELIATGRYNTCKFKIRTS